MNALLMKGVTIIDGTGAPPLPDAFLRVEGGRISAVGRMSDLREDQGGEDVLALEGRTVLPGLINAHEHLTFRRYHGTFQDVVMGWSDARLMLHGAASCLASLSEGITTVRDIGGKGLSNILLKEAVADGSLIGPRILADGSPIAMTGGHGWQICREVDSPDEARLAARELLLAGADFIKCMASGGFVAHGQDQPGSQQLTTEEMRAAFDEAHRIGRRTTVHAHPPTAIRAAIEAGVDCVEHGGLLDDATAELMAAKGVYLVPTLSALRITAEKGAQMGRPAWLVEVSQKRAPAQIATFQKAVRAGVKIVTGVDSIGEMVREMELLMEGGLSPMDTIVAATSRAAQCLDIADSVGSIEVGKCADLIVVAGNPLTNIRALDNIEWVLKDGKRYRPDDLRAMIGTKVGT
ncbi:MAG TPA: amidohydrolase family protein [Chloroflexi bacterium]|nr:amidohydrolase family protein [Chloroflexota bacterium]